MPLFTAREGVGLPKTERGDAGLAAVAKVYHNTLTKILLYKSAEITASCLIKFIPPRRKLTGAPVLTDSPDCLRFPSAYCKKPNLVNQKQYFWYSGLSDIATY